MATIVSVHTIFIAMVTMNTTVWYDTIIQSLIMHTCFACCLLQPATKHALRTEHSNNYPVSKTLQIPSNIHGWSKQWLVERMHEENDPKTQNQWKKLNLLEGENTNFCLFGVLVKCYL